ncbi:MAG: alpha/beta fold hydrolase [Calditrichaeota bacterium]|nr:MAG: alpha/beta fold hydrolase [Calditrichota bacterium]MBL1204463.1 alpha/beta fold hydrolase [Calditrichota bacterium]
MMKLVLAISFFMVFACDNVVKIDEEGLVETDGIQTFYRKIGSGPILVVVHGGPGLDHSYMLPHWEILSKKFTLIFYDQRGTGKTSSKVDSSLISMNQFVEDLEALRTGLNLSKINLIGHSWGGLLAMNYALRYSENINKIILANSIGPSYDDLNSFVYMRNESFTEEDVEIQKTIMAKSGFVTGDREVITSLLQEIFKVYFDEPSNLQKLNLTISKNTAKNIFKINGLMLKELVAYNIQNKLQNLKIPSLVIHGENDLITLESSKKILQSLVNARLEIIKNCGHFPAIEQPEQFSKIVSTFLLHE